MYYTHTHIFNVCVYIYMVCFIKYAYTHKHLFLIFIYIYIYKIYQIIGLWDNDILNSLLRVGEEYDSERSRELKSNIQTYYGREKHTDPRQDM